MSVLYDAGVFVAAERNDRVVWADHRARLELGLVPRTTAPVVAQVARSPRQVQLGRMLRGCEILAFAAHDADSVGSLLGRAGTADVVDAHLVVMAVSRAATVVTADPDDLRRLAAHVSPPVPIQRV